MSIESLDGELLPQQQAAFERANADGDLAGDELTRRKINAWKPEDGDDSLNQFMDLRKRAIESGIKDAAKVVADMGSHPEDWQVANAEKPDLEEK